MKMFSVALVYLGFFTLIGVAVYLTKSATPLWALLLAPTYKSNDDEKKEVSVASSN